jgi:hypothetical protein
LGVAADESLKPAASGDGTAEVLHAQHIE